MDLNIKKLQCADYQLSIKQFDLNNMVLNPTIALIAKRRSGKSYVCRELLHHFSTIPTGIIISPTEEIALEKFYSKFFPDAFIHDAFDIEVLEKFLKRQINMRDKFVEKYKSGKYFDSRSLLLMDDCLADDSWKKNPSIRTIFLNGRHYNITFILTLQYLKGITPDLRSNFDYIFLFAEPNALTKTKLFKEFAGMFPNYNMFSSILDELTADHGCMVIDNSNKTSSNNLSDMIFHFKARTFTNEKVNPFGSYQMQEFNRKYYKKTQNNNKMKEIEDIGGIAKSKTKFIINKL